MKTHNLIIILSGLIFIFLASNVDAACVEPDWPSSCYESCSANYKACDKEVWATRTSCYEVCGKISDLIERTKCGNKCDSELYRGMDACSAESTECREKCDDEYSRKLNDYNVCLETGRQQAKQKKIEEQQKLEEQQKEEEIEKASTAQITNVKGELKIRRSDNTEETLTSDTAIHFGDLIETNKLGGHAMITFPDGSTVEVGADSQLQFFDDKIVKLLFGKIIARIRKYEIKTPVAVLGVRGTDFIVEHNAATNITTIYLHEGILDVTNIKGETFELSVGETMTVDSSGKTVKLGLSEDDWYGLANSIETGEEFVPSQETQTGTTTPGEQKKGMAFYLSLIAMVVLIVFGTFFIKRKKPKEIPTETQLNEYQKRVQALIKKIQIIAFIIAAIIVVAVVFSSLIR